MARKVRPLDKYIARNTELLARLIALMIIIWYVSGVFLIDYINPIVFIVIWIPLGLLAAFFAYKW